MFPVLDFLEDEIPRSAPMNMALDEVLWRIAPRPLLRVYEWDHPALSFGFFGRYQDIAQYENNREVVRRCTGGGIVFHGHDLTYALIIPASERICAESSVAIYLIVHQAVVNALVGSKIAATLQPALPRTVISPGNADACFANPVAADVVIGNRKVAGAAQRRSRGGLLQQGSIQNVQLPADFRRRFTEALSSNVVPYPLDNRTLERAGELAASKYASEKWLKRR